MTDFIQITVSCPDAACAQNLAQTLVKTKLVACAQLINPITSIYLWQGQVEQESEVLLLLKSHLSLFAQIENKIAEIHPYDVPEIIAQPLVAISADYRTWLAEICLTPDN